MAKILNNANCRAECMSTGDIYFSICCIRVPCKRKIIKMRSVLCYVSQLLQTVSCFPQHYFMLDYMEEW